VSNKNGFSTTQNFQHWAGEPLYARYETVRNSGCSSICFHTWYISTASIYTLPTTNQMWRAVATLLQLIWRSAWSRDTNRQDESSLLISSQPYGRSIYGIERNKVDHKEELVIPVASCGRWQPSRGRGLSGPCEEAMGKPSRSPGGDAARLVGSRSHDGICSPPWLIDGHRMASCWIDAALSVSHRRARRCGSRERRSVSRGGHPRDGMEEEDRTEMVRRGMERRTRGPWRRGMESWKLDRFRKNILGNSAGLGYTACLGWRRFIVLV
jgi:hypothetical protein